MLELAVCAHPASPSQATVSIAAQHCTMGMLVFGMFTHFTYAIVYVKGKLTNTAMLVKASLCSCIALADVCMPIQAQAVIMNLIANRLHVRVPQKPVHCSEAQGGTELEALCTPHAAVRIGPGLVTANFR